MATKKTSTKKATTKKAAAKGTPKAKKEELVTFAIRLPEAERDAIHVAAGPRGATRFVRAVAVAAAREDEKAFRQALKEAREARS